MKLPKFENTPYESFIYLQKMQYQQNYKLRCKNAITRYNFNRIYEIANSQNVMKRIQASELLLYWFQQNNVHYLQNSVYNNTIDRVNVNEKQENGKEKLALLAINKLLIDEVEEIRLTAAKCCIFFDTGSVNDLDNSKLFEQSHLLIFPFDSFNSQLLIKKKIKNC